MLLRLQFPVIFHLNLILILIYKILNKTNRGKLFNLHGFKSGRLI